MLLSQEDLLQSAKPDAKLKKYREDNPRQAFPNDPQMIRASVDAMTTTLVQALGDPPIGQAEFYHNIAMRDEYASTLKILKPSDGRPAGPLVALCFGGAFIAGNKDQFTEMGRVLVQLFGATVVLISYRLAPEYKFPFAQLDAWDSMRWIADNATSPVLNADPSNGFVFGGLSAGGAIASALSRKFQEDALRYALTGQWLSMASIMSGPEQCPEEYRSYHVSQVQNDNTEELNKAARELIERAVEWDDDSDLRYAVNSKTSLAGQPRTVFQVCGMDPLRDDSLVYDEMLRKAGVETKLYFYPGCPHAHHMTMPTTEIAQRARIDEIEGIGWLLGKMAWREDIAKSLKLGT